MNECKNFYVIKIRKWKKNVFFYLITCKDEREYVGVLIKISKYFVRHLFLSDCFHFLLYYENQWLQKLFSHFYTTALFLLQHKNDRRNTVKPLYSGHHLDILKMSTLYRGIHLMYHLVERTIRRQLYQLIVYYRSCVIAKIKLSCKGEPIIFRVTVIDMKNNHRIIRRTRSVKVIHVNIRPSSKIHSVWSCFSRNSFILQLL